MNYLDFILYRVIKLTRRDINFATQFYPEIIAARQSSFHFDIETDKGRKKYINFAFLSTPRGYLKSICSDNKEKTILMRMFRIYTDRLL